jgi:hypothetical protein
MFTLRALRVQGLSMITRESRAIRCSRKVFSSARSQTPTVVSDETDREELIKSITRKLRGDLIDKDGNVPTGVDRPIAIEVDGPSHFYVNSTKYTAYTKLKHRLLTRMGYRVLHVPYFEWRKLRGARERENYLREKLKEEPTEWLEPEDEKLFAERVTKAEEAMALKPPPPKGPRPTRRK